MQLFLLCLIYNTLASVILMLILNANPRLMLQDYPKEIIEKVPPKTKEEKRKVLLPGILFMFILIAFPLIYGLYNKIFTEMGFWQNWWRIAVLFFSFNLTDLLILDWLIFCGITPKFIIIPGTEGNPGYKNYMYHFKSFLKGSVITALSSFIIIFIIEAIAFLL